MSDDISFLFMCEPGPLIFRKDCVHQIEKILTEPVFRVIICLTEKCYDGEE